MKQVTAAVLALAVTAALASSAAADSVAGFYKGKTIAIIVGYHVPSVYDFAKTEDDRQVLDLLFGWRVLGRPIAAPPGVPAERLAALRKAFLDAMNDKRFVADAAKAQLDIAPAPGEEVANLVARLFSHSKDTIKRAADVVRN